MKEDQEHETEQVSTTDDPWWETRVLHAKLYPAKDRKA